MMRVTILYPDQDGGRFDWPYYLNTHMPMAIEKFGPSLKGVSVEQGMSGVQPGTSAAYVALCHLTFDSAEAFLAAFLPHAQVIQDDIKQYTNVEPLMQFSEVKLSR